MNSKRQSLKPENNQNSEITSRQKIKNINIKKINLILKEVFFLLNEPRAKVSILFCDNKFISKLNKKFFKNMRPTDVIAFPLQDKLQKDYLGEIVISVEQAEKACPYYGKKWQEELMLYLIHGILHLLGYDDTKAKEKLIMDRKQERILQRLVEADSNLIYSIDR